MPRRPSQVAKDSPRYSAELRVLGERIRALRQAKDWTLERAAEVMDLDLKHLQKIEAGSINVTMVTLVRIAEGFEESVATLFATSRKKNRSVGPGRQ